MNLVRLFSIYPLYSRIGKALHAEERLKFLLRLRLLNKEFRTVASRWNLWWTFWSLPCDEYVDFMPLNRFMTRVCVHFMDTYLYEVIKNFNTNKNFTAREQQRLCRASQLHSFSQLVRYHSLVGADFEYFYGLFNTLLHDLSEMHNFNLEDLPNNLVPQKPLTGKRKKKVHHGFVTAEQKNLVLRIFSACELMVRRIGRGKGTQRYDVIRFVRAKKFLNRARICNCFS